MSVLNPALYEAMAAVFGADNVRVTYDGIPMSGTYVRDLHGRPRFQPVIRGEYLVTHCPYCRDRRWRLWINHSWGTKDPETGYPRYWLAICFNEDCLRKGDNLEHLKESLSNYRVQAASGGIEIPVVMSGPAARLRVNSLPPDFVLLSNLSRRHIARTYVVERRFDPVELAQVWGIGFASDQWVGRGRLVIPLRARLKDAGIATKIDAYQIVGYQRRLLGPPRVLANGKKEPKYLTDGPKSELLYGLDRVPLDDSPVVCARCR
jgi:hypothetical protein